MNKLYHLKKIQTRLNHIFQSCSVCYTFRPPSTCYKIILLDQVQLDSLWTQTLKLCRYDVYSSVCFHVITFKINYANRKMERKLDIMFLPINIKTFCFQLINGRNTRWTRTKRKYNSITFFLISSFGDYSEIIQTKLLHNLYLNSYGVWTIYFAHNGNILFKLWNMRHVL